MAQSPLDNAGGPLNVSVFCDGTKIRDLIVLHSVQIEEAEGGRAKTVLKVEASGGVRDDLTRLAANPFKIGGTLTVSAGYGGAREIELFKGKIMELGFAVDQMSMPVLEIYGEGDPRLQPKPEQSEDDTEAPTHPKPEISLTYGYDVLDFEARTDAPDLSQMRADLTCQGTGLAKIGDTIELHDFGMLSGLKQIEKVAQQIAEGRWVSRISCRTLGESVELPRREARQLWTFLD